MPRGDKSKYTDKQERKAENHAPSDKGGRKSQASRTYAERSAAAKKGAATRKRNAEHHAHH
jgi:hypothetical protein